MKNTPDGNRLKSYVQRIERMLADKAEIQNDIKDVYTEVKSAGYNPKIVRVLIKERAEDAQKRAEREEMLELYRDALGGLADTPLGHAAMEKL